MHFGHLLPFISGRENNAVQTDRDICAIYGVGAITESTVYMWFAMFRGIISSERSKTFRQACSRNVDFLKIQVTQPGTPERNSTYHT